MQSHIELTLAQPAQSLPECLPNLMPFHIKHTGAAPISTYFHVEPASDAVGVPPPDDSSSKNDLNPDTSESQTTEGTSQNTIVDAISSNQNATDSGKRFTSTFRGRTIQALKFDLPEGYVGVLLKSNEKPKTTNVEDMRDLQRSRSARRGRGRGKATGRGTRRSTRSVAADEVEDVDEDVVMDDDAPSNDIDAAADELGNSSLDSVPAQQLQVISQFSQLMVWHPDMPVDENSDDYIRALKEWTFLASEIHRIEDT